MERRRGFGFWWLAGNIIGRAAPRESKGYTMETEDRIPWRQMWRGALAIDFALAILFYLARWLPLWTRRGAISWVSVSEHCITVLLPMVGIAFLGHKFRWVPKTVAGVALATAPVWLLVAALLGMGRYANWYESHNLYALQAWKDIAVQTALWNIPPGFLIILPIFARRNALEVNRPFYQQESWIPKVLRMLIGMSPEAPEVELPPVMIPDDFEEQNGSQAVNG